MSRRSLYNSTLAALAAFTLVPAQAAPADDIRLVLQITVDGLRGDLLQRYRKSFGPGGFRMLLDTGAVFTNAHYLHANTETIVGHTTLATGAHPSDHGMVGNVWLDRGTGELSYNIEDARYPLLPTRNDATQSAQLDPAQRQSRSNGRSPANILASTIADEIALHFAGRPKVFGISGKDRGAVSMAGHVGKAFWFSTDSGDFVTSTYYYNAYPGWVAQWNADRPAAKFANTSWKLLNEPSTYLLKDQDDRPYETDLKGYGRVFPHAFGGVDDKLFTTRLLVGPAGDRLTLDFSKALISNEGLGQDEIPDYLAISFSGVDAVNHFFGPSSLENEDVILQLDRVLADLFAFVDRVIGLNRTLIVLSADHGMPEIPEYIASTGMKVSRLYSEDLTTAANSIAAQQFGIAKAVERFFRPYLYLDSRAIAAAGVDKAVVARAVAQGLSLQPGIAAAIATSSLPSLSSTDMVERIRRNTHRARSGDIYVTQEPYWFLYEKGPIAAMHGSTWRYDSYVPIIIAGATVKPRRINRPVHPIDVAPTIAAYLGVKPPSSAVGRPLVEVLE